MKVSPREFVRAYPWEAPLFAAIVRGGVRAIERFEALVEELMR